MNDPGRMRIELPPKPRGVRLHCRLLPEPVELPVRYGGVDDGNHVWIATVPTAVLTAGEAFDANGPTFHLTIDEISGATTVVIEIEEQTG